MKLHHFVTATPSDSTQKLRNLGKALAQPTAGATMPVAEAKKPTQKLDADAPSDGMDAAIHTMTQDHKHLHKKLAHHD